VKTSVLEIETMSNTSGSSVPTGFLTLTTAMILAAGVGGKAAARHTVRTVHFRGLNARAQYVQGVPVQQNGGSTATRYYDGPKSPMWRATRLAVSIYGFSPE
jgi:hypothetical protein